MEKITLNATPENITEVTNFIDCILENLSCPMKSQAQIDIAIDEVFGNIAYYAYKGGVGDATVCADYEDETGMFCITFIDSGVEYNPLMKEDPDVTLDAESREIGGLGIFMVKNIMDDITYEYENGCNILKIYKKIF